MTDTKEREKLLPCPFCGKTDKLSLGDWSVADSWCVECDRCKYSQHAIHTRDGAIAAWNTRDTARSGERDMVLWFNAILPHIERLLESEPDKFGIDGDGINSWPVLAEFVTRGRVIAAQLKSPSGTEGGVR